MEETIEIIEDEAKYVFIEPEDDGKCPICREKIYTVGRCKTCLSCGWSLCEV